jgi:hypothetical protein
VPADKRDALDGGATKPAAPAAGRH